MFRALQAVEIDSVLLYSVQGRVDSGTRPTSRPEKSGLLYYYIKVSQVYRSWGKRCSQLQSK